MAQQYQPHMVRGHPPPLSINTGQTSHDQRRLAQQQRTGQRFSWGQTPVEMQEPVFGQPGTQGQRTRFEPVEQPIAQSPAGIEERGQGPRGDQHAGGDARGHVEYNQGALAYTDDMKKDSKDDLSRQNDIHPAYRSPILPNSQENPAPRRTVVWPASYMDPAMISGVSQQRQQSVQPPLAQGGAMQPYSPDAIGTPAPIARAGTFASLSNLNSQQEPFNPVAPTRIATLPHLPSQLPHPNMSIPPPPPANLPNSSADPDAKSSWTTSLFSLCNPALSVPDTLLSLCLPCIIDSRTSYRLSAASNGQDPTNLLSFSTPNPRCLGTALCGPCGLLCLLPCVNRVRIRRRYGIEGGLCGDCVASSCCCCCVVALNEREVKGREEAKREKMGPAGIGVREEMVYRAGG